MHENRVQEAKRRKLLANASSLKLTTPTNKPGGEGRTVLKAETKWRIVNSMPFNSVPLANVFHFDRLTKSILLPPLPLFLSFFFFFFFSHREAKAKDFISRPITEKWSYFNFRHQKWKSRQLFRTSGCWKELQRRWIESCALTWIDRKNPLPSPHQTPTFRPLSLASRGGNASTSQFACLLMTPSLPIGKEMSTLGNVKTLWSGPLRSCRQSFGKCV